MAQLKGWMHNRLMSNVGVFFFSDLSQFLDVGFVLVNKHYPVFFFPLVCSSFSRNNVCKKLSFLCGIFGDLLLNEKQKKP